VVVGVDLPDTVLDLAPGVDGWVRVADWSVWPHGLDRPIAEAIAAVVDAPLVVEEVPSGEAAADDEPAVDARRPWTLMVRVLGPVDVVDAEGRQAEFERAKALELVTWLAQHPQSATRAGARAALWAIDVSNASFSNVVSEARRAMARLASPPDGGDWVARTYAQRLPLHPEVVLDADLVRRHLDQARRLPDPDAIEELRQALELVRGAPYAGRSYLWPDAEALPSTLTLLVTTVATELGRRLLDAGDLDGVFAATAVGLDVLPGHEELIALRLRAHAQRGDRSALHREYMSYEHAVLADPWDGEPSPTLAALRRELLQPVAGE
jgi:two-component SAPR family response regulator